MKLLLHFCCGPCGVMPSKLLLDEGVDFTGFWYNPNIHPYAEHKSRLESFRRLAELRGFETIVRDEYGLRPFVAEVAGDIDGRCSFCYGTRMDAAARAAKENGFDAFSTTLLVSPYQKHEEIVEAGMAAALRHGLKFYYRDFRPYFRKGQKQARELELYMQKYCGCIFSEEERYLKKAKA